MYQIGMFSKINRITTKTLRHYDEIGLLKPEYVDDFTGYRYYSSRQLQRLHRIMALKRLGLGLAEIKDAIDNPGSINIYLKLKEKEIEERIKEEETRLLHVKNYIKRMKGELNMNYNPVIKSLPEVIVASMRTVIPSYNTYFEIVPQMGEEMKSKGAICAVPEYCFTIYHDGEYKERDIDVEICEAVEDYCENSGRVKYKKINEVETAVCVLHKGPYSTIRDAYLFAFQWINDNGYKIVGQPRESYIDGIWNRDDENDWLTELQVPVSKS